MGEKVGEKLGEKVGEKTGEKVGESLGEIHKLNLCQDLREGHLHFAVMCLFHLFICPHLVFVFVPTPSEVLYGTMLGSWCCFRKDCAG